MTRNTSRSLIERPCACASFLKLGGQARNESTPVTPLCPIRYPRARAQTHRMWAVLVLSGSAPRVKDRLGSPVIIVQVRRTKRSMSSGAENRSRCPLLTLSVPLRPRRDAPSLLLSGFSIELEARIWFAAQQGRDLRGMKTRPCAPGKINAPPRLTSQNISPAPFRLFLCGANLSRALTARKKRQNVELSRGRVGFWPLFGR